MNGDIDLANLDTNQVVKNRIKELQGDGFYRPERFKTLASQAATDELDAFFLRSLGIEVTKITLPEESRG